MQFVNIHRHDEFSLYDGFGTAKQAARYAKEIGQPALGLTNHGNICGLVEHYVACRDEGIKPILGVEAYYQPKYRPEQGAKRYHLTILCESFEGYQNLTRMLGYANRQQFYNVPIIDWKLLNQHSAGLIILSGCMLGYIPTLIARGLTDKARLVAEAFKGRFGDRFYLEVQPIAAAAQKQINDELQRIGEDLKIPCVMTLDSHFTRPDDHSSYETMWKIGQRGEAKADYSQRYMMQAPEIARLWGRMHRSNHSPMVHTTMDIAERCNVELEFKETLPHQEWGTVTSKEMLRDIAVDFVESYCKDKKTQVRAQYWDRLNKELKVITGKGFEDYFLLCWDVVRYAKSRNIATSFGRGSVCGSLVAYSLGLTKVDPLILGTSFERFLRPDKNVIPDIDIDFDAERRHEVIAYVLEKFKGRSMPISTFQRRQAKSLWLSLAKVYEVEKDDVIRAKLYLEYLCAGDQQGTYIEIAKEQIRSDDYLSTLDKTYPGILDDFRLLYGQVSAFGKHAAGIAITAGPIDDYLASTRIRDELQTSYDMDSLARLNILKIDILGLHTMSVVRAIEEQTSKTFGYWVLNKKYREPILAAFREGQTEGIFQFEKGGAKRILQLVQPDSMNDLIACNALNRPGPDIESFVAAKNGELDQMPWHSYVADTYGAIVYQEQVMGICRAAGLEWAETDKVMKAVNAKQLDRALQAKFIPGAMKAFNLTKAQAAELFRRNTLYCFNKGHSAGYTLIGYYLMYHKLNNPLEFWWATLRYEQDDNKHRIYQARAAQSGIVILPPHVNGTAYDSIEDYVGNGDPDDRVIRLGLMSIKGIGEKVALAIEMNRKLEGPYQDDIDFHNRLPKRVAGKGVTAALDREDALEFDKDKFNGRTVAYNRSLMMMDAEIR